MDNISIRRMASPNEPTVKLSRRLCIKSSCRRLLNLYITPHQRHANIAMPHPKQQSKDIKNSL